MKLTVGFLTYNDLTSKYLPFFLPSLEKSLGFALPGQDYQIIALDNSEVETNANRDYILKNHPEVKLAWAGGNLGFARGYNRLIAQSRESGAEYFLMINPDTTLDENAIKILIASLEADPKLGAAAPRILKWDFVNNQKTNIIDSDGLFITASHRFSDRHQGLEAKKSEPEMVFGFTGAAALIRMRALQEAAFINPKTNQPEYLDELMFMYKEDVDLSYRLQLAGWPIRLEPSALVYHDRTASPVGENFRAIMKNRKNKSRSVKEWSFLNHWILVLKYGRLPYSFRVKYQTWFYQLASLFFALIFEPYLIRTFFKLFGLMPKIKTERRNLSIKIKVAEIEKMMEK